MRAVASASGRQGDAAECAIYQGQYPVASTASTVNQFSFEFETELSLEEPDRVADTVLANSATQSTQLTPTPFSGPLAGESLASAFRGVSTQ